ncbi:MAG TPA: carbamoyltransferase C-terminal domain-containing protein [Streptosporangiaceae bacterium]|jgi:hypothetical protein
MVIAGLALTAGGGLALLSDGKLELSVPFSHLGQAAGADATGVDATGVDRGLGLAAEVLAAQGMTPGDLGQWVLDGGPGDGELTVGGMTAGYVNYPHAAGQVAAAYCTSPFAASGTGAAVLAWDRGGSPLLYQVGADGQVMPGVTALSLADAMRNRGADTLAGAGALAYADALAGEDWSLAELLAEQAAAAMRDRLGPGPHQLCVTGDTALHPAWATALRDYPLIGAVWIPPCPDGSGWALGACCLHAAGGAGLRAVQWDARLGLPLDRTPHPAPGWAPSPCRLEELARLLHHSGEPAVVLHGRAALGPRALGMRSILAAATSPEIRQRLAAATGLPQDRPVPALCLEQEAAEVFEPGSADPYRAYLHRVRPAWRDRVPAVCGPDGTARVQTVSATDDARLAEILREYQVWSGVPVLCALDAAGQDGAPFRSAGAAMEWGHLDTVWSDGILYRRSPDRHGGAR